MSDGVGIKQNLSLVILATIYWSLALLDPWDLFGNAREAVELAQNLAWLSFVLIHGIRRYGLDSMSIFFGITFLISWSTETSSIATGFPFGNYYYSHLLGVKIGTVPLTIMSAYFVAGYLAWTMGTIFLGDLGTGIEKRNLFLVPFVSSFIMVMWDFCLDPISSTIDGAWIWENGGAYHGVPISNYFGWYLTVFIIFQVFALYLYRFRRNERVGLAKIYWYLVPVMFLGLALEYLLNPFVQTANLDIYWSLLLGAILTMVFTSILNIIAVKRLDEDSAELQPENRL
jgi:putative membrane protein